MDLVTVHNDQLVTSSRMVAEKFGKQHKHVLETIAELIKAENSALTQMFYETTYQAGTGKNYKEYLMNRDGFSLLVMGFTGKEALQFKLDFINAFNAMEKKLKEMALPQDSYMIDDPVERAKRWIEEATERKVLQEKNAKLEGEVVGLNNTIDQLKPKADYLDRILKSTSLVTTTQIAKDYGMGAPTFNKKLKEMKLQYKAGGQWLLYAKHQGKGYASSETIEIELDDGRTKTVMNTKWTQKGRLWLYDVLKANGILPIIERSESEKAETVLEGIEENGSSGKAVSQC